ncbi:MAG: energy-coupling factor transporter transmembrane protein EcfT [Kouleothrix sp.]|nr:energy-coupling factor transporter transmembrane protein EcfT [Kouleothrix sp.]
MAVEFSRDITFGQYLDLGSPIHRLDPRAKILAWGALMLATFLARTSFAGYAILAVGAVLIQIVSHIPLSYTLRGMRLLFSTLLIIIAFQVLFFPNPSESGTLWRWWLLSISTDGLRQGLVLLVRVVLLYYWTSTLMYITPMMDLADGTEIMLDPLKRLRLPVNELVLVMVIAIRFVPLLVAELERLIKAQTARGARFDQGNLLQRVRKLGPLLIPLFVNSFGRAETLTTAMNARCYRGGRGRTKRRVLTFHQADLLAMTVAVLFAAAAISVSRLGFF